MQYAAFQSHLWNELLRRLIRLKVEDYREVRGKEGGYLFWRRLDPSSLAYFQSLEIPTAALKTDFPDSLTRKLADKILEEKGLRDGMFRTKALSRVYFRSFLRKALLTPDDIRVTGLADDELHRGKKKLTLSFSLPRGAYATILIKRLEL
jgi:tRNA pseudouridine13 synthase